jgi:hypothetical protein
MAVTYVPAADPTLQINVVPGRNAAPTALGATSRSVESVEIFCRQLGWIGP